MKNPYHRRPILLLIIIAFHTFLAGCQSSDARNPGLPTPNLSATVAFKTRRSATPTQPTLAPTYFTPAPTITPLLGSGHIITPTEYNQTLILEVGETFILEKLSADTRFVVDKHGVIEQISGPEDPTQGDQEYRATAPGTIYFTFTVPYPCPNAPMGCQPPLMFTLVVIVSGEGTPTPTLPLRPFARR